VNRPRSATPLALLCALTVVFTAWRDLTLPHVRDIEVWLGFEVHGALARATAPLHWAIFATGAWAFATARPWAWSAAAGYVLYVALAHLVWSEASPKGQGWPMGLLQAAGFSLIAWGVWRLRRRGAAAFGRADTPAIRGGSPP
jgi:hypothetical protein